MRVNRVALFTLAAILVGFMLFFRGDNAKSYTVDLQAQVIALPKIEKALLGRTPHRPASDASVAWLKNVPLFQWIDIPNSQLTTHLGDEYFARIGLPRPTQRGYSVSWGTNKYGLNWPNWEGYGWNQSHYSYSGMAFDSRGSKLLIGGGDAHWAENGVHVFQFGVDVPKWTQEYIRSSGKDYFKNPRPDRSFPTPVSGDDRRDDRMYDGGHRGGHSYFAQQFLEAREWYVHFYQQQYWPLDEGGSAAVHVAENGKWRSDNPIPNMPNWTNDENVWVQKHPVTEDVYCWGIRQWGEGVLSVWRQAANKWEQILSLPEEAGARVTGSIDWTNGYILFGGSIGGQGPQAKPRFWITNLNSPKKIPVTLVGPHAAAFQPYRNGGLWWNPDLRKHLWYPDDGYVYTLERTGPAKFSVDRLPMTGIAPTPDAQFKLKGGGILNNFQYVPELRGMVLRIADNLPIKFFRTANSDVSSRPTPARERPL